MTITKPRLTWLGLARLVVSPAAAGQPPMPSTPPRAAVAYDPDTLVAAAALLTLLLAGRRLVETFARRSGTMGRPRHDRDQPAPAR